MLNPPVTEFIFSRKSDLDKGQGFALFNEIQAGNIL